MFTESPGTCTPFVSSADALAAVLLVQETVEKEQQLEGTPQPQLTRNSLITDHGMTLLLKSTTQAQHLFLLCDRKRNANHRQ